MTPHSKRNFQDYLLNFKRRKLCYEDILQRSDVISPAVEKHVKEYYERDDVSRMLPGKKYVKRVVINGETVKKKTAAHDHKRSICSL